MKKRVVSILLCAVMICSMLAGCGDKAEESKKETTEEISEEETLQIPSLDDIDVEKCVELGEYRGITVTNTIEAVTDDVIDTWITEQLSSNPLEVEDENAKVEEGDTVNIDYEGKLDGVAFDGGTAEDTDLVIGSGQFIDGFESGLVGLTKGTTVDLDLTFPENYSSEDLAGQNVVFTVTINAIKRPITEITDEWVLQNSEDCKNVEEYRESVKTQLEDEAEATAEENLPINAWMQVVDGSTINEYPEYLLEYGRESYQSQLETYAQYYEMDVEEYVEAQGMTMEEHQSQKESYAESIAKQMVVLKAIIEKEGLTTETEEYQTILDGFLSEYEVDEEGLNEQFGENAVYQTIMMQIVNDLIVNEADIKEVVE